MGEVAVINYSIPRPVAPELDERVYSVEFVPGSLNGKKGAKIGRRQWVLARERKEVGLYE